MSKTRLELVNICKRKTKDTSSTSASGFQEDLVTAEGIVDSILNGNQSRKKATTLSLVDGTATYSLPSDVASIEQILITSPTTDEKLLIQVDKETFRATNPVASNDSESIPSYWYFSEPTVASTGVETKQITFYPIPDKSYTATYSYLQNSTLMDSDSDYPFFDERYHVILCDYAIWQYYERETDESGNPMYWQNKWNQDLAWLIETYPKDSKQQLAIPGPDQYEGD